jgi:hypothetical protein
VKTAVKTERNVKVNIALITAFMTLILMVSAVFFIAHESAHECKGEECPICAALHYFENILYETNAGCTATAAAVTLLVLVADTLVKAFFGLCGETPVSMKVRMDS